MTLVEDITHRPGYRAQNPFCTLVIGTRGRSQELLECLHSIPNHERRNYRVIIVDQNDAPFLAAMLEPLAQKIDLTHLRVPFRNACRARNAGAQLTSTPWLAFPDDDCRFLPDTLTIARQRIAHDDLDLLTGQLVDEDEHPHIMSWPPAECPVDPESFERCFAESTFFLRKSVFDSVSGFDPNFGPGTRFPSAEGAEMLCRIWRKSPPLRGLYTPTIRFFHPNKDSGISAEIHSRIEKFAFGEGAFTIRHFPILPLKRIAHRLAKSAVGVVVGGGLPRRRRLAYVRGFFLGALAYLILPLQSRTTPTQPKSYAR